MENPVAPTPISKNVAEAAVAARYSKDRAVAVASANAPGNEALKKAVESATNKNATETMVYLEQLAAPEDHASEIRQIADKFGNTYDAKGRKEALKPTNPDGTTNEEYIRQEAFVKQATLMNDLLQKGYDGLEDIQDASGTVTYSKDAQQADLRQMVTSSLEGDANFKTLIEAARGQDVAEAISNGLPATDKNERAFVEKYLKNNNPDGKIVLGKLNTYLTDALNKGSQFTGVDIDGKHRTTRTAQREADAAQQPIKDAQTELNEVKKQLDEIQKAGAAKDEIDALKTTEANDKKKVTDVDKQTVSLKRKLASQKQLRSDAYASQDRAGVDDAEKEIAKLNADIRSYENADYDSAKANLDKLNEYRATEKNLKSQKTALESQIKSLKLAAEEKNDNLNDAQASEKRTQDEHAYQEKKFTRQFSTIIGKAVIEHEVTEAILIAKKISERIPVEEQQIRAQQNESEKKMASGANDYLDKRWKKERKSIKGTNWIWKSGKWVKEGGITGLASKLGDKLFDQDRERVDEKSEALYNAKYVEDDYQRIVNQPDGIDQTLAGYVVEVIPAVYDVTGTMTTPERKKTYAELNEANANDKRQKDLIRNTALRHTLNVRDTLSQAESEKTGKPPKKVTESDQKKLLDKTWIESAIIDGVKTEQAQKALETADPAVPGDEPVTKEDMDKAKAGDKNAIAKLKRIMLTNRNKFALILGIPLILVAAGVMSGAGGQSGH
jgi:hypothetical protein